MQLEDYQAFISGSGKAVVYEGPRLALVIADSARSAEFNPDVNDAKTTEAMKDIVTGLHVMLSSACGLHMHGFCPYILDAYFTYLQANMT